MDIWVGLEENVLWDHEICLCNKLDTGRNEYWILYIIDPGFLNQCFVGLFFETRSGM